MDFFKNIPRPIWIFTLIWFIAGLLQAGLMELHPDEAYYWQMSRFMDWGYFHQPPMVAVFIKLGYSLFQNELGVRLVTVVSSTLGILILFKLSETKDVKTFILVFLGMILTHAGVFMAVPDSPLIFFTLVFLVLLKEYLSNDKLITALALGVVAAALMYSKYHAIVLFASVLVAAPRLLLRKTFWITAILTTVLFLPHIIWQFEHNLVSYKFHWVVRDKSLWEIGMVLNYFGGQLLLLGPVGFILIWALLTYKTEGDFNRVLKFITIGFFSFFLILSFRSRVEANWTATAFLPLIILGVRSSSGQAKILRFLKPTAIVCASILIVARIYLATPLAGVGFKTSFPLVGWAEWAQTLKTQAKGKPIVFTCSYQYPSMYSFYAKEQAYHWSTISYNGNQFDLWNIDTALIGKPYEMAVSFGIHYDNSAINAPGFSPFYLLGVDSYQSYRNLRFLFNENAYVAKASSTLQLSGRVSNLTDQAINLDSLLKEKQLTIFYYLNGELFPTEHIQCDGCFGKLAAGESKNIHFAVRVPEEKGNYFIRFGLDFARGMQEQNSDFIKLTVQEN